MYYRQQYSCTRAPSLQRLQAEGDRLDQDALHEWAGSCQKKTFRSFDCSRRQRVQKRCAAAISGNSEVGEKYLNADASKAQRPRNGSWNYKVVPSRELRPAQSCAPSCCAMGNSAQLSADTECETCYRGHIGIKLVQQAVNRQRSCASSSWGDGFGRAAWTFPISIFTVSITC
jgi:hypothetical protein